ncbi:MFS family permease [Rhodopseudomonas julia]|uniref:MFS family permease n=2 Tax=Rhodopseudomonas julia TaxID=200617 RepID=A0ABU0C6I6_9BRAD|nr:MFS family permease [Rhodopseudomonas julia]
MAGHIATLALGVVFISTGVALARPTFMAALSFYVSAQRQGVVMGAAQSLVAFTDIVTPVFAGAIVGQTHYGLWIGLVVAVAVMGAVIAVRRLPASDPETRSATADVAI